MIHTRISSLNNTTNYKQNKLIYAVITLVILSFATYLNTLSNTFVFDDIYTISENYFIRDWGNISDLFTSKYFTLSGELSYRPVVTLSYFIDYSLWGLNPHGYHLTNVLFHTLNGVLLFLFIQHITKGNTLIPFLTSLIFVCHPVLSETINAISYREDLMAAGFFLIAFILYIKLQPGKSYFYPLSLLSYSFALFSKEMAISLPLLLFFYDHIMGNRYAVITRILRFYTGYALITIFYLFMRFRWFHNPVESSVVYPGESLWINFLTMTKILASYIKCLFFPITFNADYIVHASPGIDIPFTISLVLLVSVAIICCRLFSYSRLLFFPVIWFFVTLLPVLNIVPIANIMAERYLYLPIIGFCIVGASLIINIDIFKSRTPSILSENSSSLLLTRKNNVNRYRISTVNFCKTTSRYFIILIILLGFSWQALFRSKDWRDEFTLWSKTLIREPGSYKAHSSLGILFIRKGLEQEGVSELQKSLLINRSYADAHNNLGTLYLQKGLYENAAKEFNYALKGNRNLSEAHYNLGIVYEKMNFYDKAVTEYKSYITGKGGHPVVFYNLGVIYMRQGDLQKSMEAFQNSLKGNPKNADAHNNLGVVLVRRGQFNSAIKEFEEALRQNPAHSDASSNLKAVYDQIKNLHK